MRKEFIKKGPRGEYTVRNLVRVSRVTVCSHQKFWSLQNFILRDDDISRLIKMKHSFYRTLLDTYNSL